MDYSYMQTSFPLIPFEEMTKKQVELYFNWFMEAKEQRIRQLETYIRQEKPDICLNKTPKSLIPLWEWFQNHVEWEDKTEEDFKKIMVGRPEWMRQHILENKKKMSVLTLTLAYDISVYFGETLITNHHDIYWGYRMKPKKLDGINRPILLGFKGDVCVFPFTLIDVCIRRCTRNPNKEELLETYKIWESNI